MNSKKTVALLGALLALGTAENPLSAQSVAPRASEPAAAGGNENIETLSPFVVNTSQDTGYQATSTLAGTRLNTPIKDLGAAISIYTKDFLADIGATSSSDLLVYATGMEAAGANGNYSDIGNDINVERPSGNGPRIEPQASSRTRGLAAPTFTRSYFATSIAFDSYNAGTVTVNRGPNAALFGVGSAAGVIDTALLLPELQRNKNSVTLRYGNNDSLRESIDLNRVLIPKKLGLRIDALHDKEEFNQRPAFEEKKRLYGALTYKPFTSTSVRASFEAGNTKANRPIPFSPYDSIGAQWFAAGRPSYDWRFYDDPVLNPNPANHGSATEGFLMANNQAGSQPIIVYSNPTDATPSFGFLGGLASTSGTAANAVRNGTLNPLVNRNLLSDSIRFLHTNNVFEIPAAYWTGANVYPGQQPGFVPAGLKAQGFTDYSAFDFRNRMIDETSIQGASSSPNNYATATVSSVLQTAAAWAVEGNINPQLAAQRNSDLALLFSALPANYRDLYNFKINGTAPNITVSGNLSSSLSGSGDTRDYVAKGTEIDLVFNPTRNWRILANVAKQETIQSNSFPFTQRFVAMMKPVWDKLGSTPRTNYPTGFQPGSPLPANTQTYSQWLDVNVYVPLTTALATDGSVSAEQRKWRANLVNNYTFGSDSIFGPRLKGFGIGGAVRWQDKLGIGYPASQSPDGAVIIDTKHPYYAPPDTNVDA